MAGQQEPVGGVGEPVQRFPITEGGDAGTGLLVPVRVILAEIQIELGPAVEAVGIISGCLAPGPEADVKLICQLSY